MTDRNSRVADPTTPEGRGDVSDSRGQEEPLVGFVLLSDCHGCLVSHVTDPENVRFLAFDSAEWPHRWYAIVIYGFVHVD